MTVTLRAGIARLGLAGWLAAAGWLTVGCSGGTDTGGGSGGGPGGGPGGGGMPPSASAPGPQPSGTAGGPQPSDTAAGQQSPGAGAGQQPPGAAGGPRPSTATAGPLRMPNLVGRNLQDAQDALHAAGVVFFATSHDATGNNRPQLVDVGWKVCSQTPRPGQVVPKGVVPDVGVVTVKESCP